MRRLLIVVTLLLAGCAATGGGLLRGSGVEVQPPHGAVTYCGTYPERAECGGTK